MTTPNRSKAAAYLVAVFLVGAVAGGATGFTLARRQASRPPPPPADMASFLVGMLKRELGLTDDQTRQIEPIAAEAAVRMQALRRDTSEKFAQLIQQTDQRIAEFLTPEQKGRFEQFCRKREEQKMGHHGPPPGLGRRGGPPEERHREGPPGGPPPGSPPPTPEGTPPR